MSNHKHNDNKCYNDNNTSTSINNDSNNISSTNSEFAPLVAPPDSGVAGLEEKRYDLPLLGR